METPPVLSNLIAARRVGQHPSGATPFFRTVSANAGSCQPDIGLARESRITLINSLTAKGASIPIGIGEMKMTYDQQIMALLVIGPYNDFISEGGKVWDTLKGVAEANDYVPHMRHVLDAARKATIRVYYALHRRYRPGDYWSWKYIEPNEAWAAQSQRMGWLWQNLGIPLGVRIVVRGIGGCAGTCPEATPLTIPDIR